MRRDHRPSRVATGRAVATRAPRTAEVVVDPQAVGIGKVDQVDQAIPVGIENVAECLAAWVIAVMVVQITNRVSRGGPAIVLWRETSAAIQGDMPARVAATSGDDVGQAI